MKLRIKSLKYKLQGHLYQNSGQTEPNKFKQQEFHIFFELQ